MKKFFPFVLCSTAAALCLNAVSAYAGDNSPRVISPRVSPPASPARVSLSAPATLPTVRTVTTVQDDGPGSLRQAIASSAPGDVVKFALRLPAVIVLKSTLVIDQDLTVLGPGPCKLTVMRSGATNTPSFRVFDVEAGVVTLAGITIRNGSAFSGTNIHDNLGGGILNRGNLTVSNCVITGNSAPTTDWGTDAVRFQVLAWLWRRHFQRPRPAYRGQLDDQRQPGHRGGRGDMHVRDRTFLRPRLHGAATTSPRCRVAG